MTCNSKFVKFAAMAFMQIALASATAIEASAADTNYELKRIDLPRASGPVALDYFAYDRATEKVWVPASNTGSVDVIDEKTDTVLRLVKLSGVDAKLRLDRQPRTLETGLFTSGTAGMGRFAWSTQRVLRASNACRSRRTRS